MMIVLVAYIERGDKDMKDELRKVETIQNFYETIIGYLEDCADINKTIEALKNKKSDLINRALSNANSINFYLSDEEFSKQLAEDFIIKMRRIIKTVENMRNRNDR